jgi:PPOX class probable F420-dependent enzyme
MAPHTTDREYGPGAGPPPAALSDDEVLALVASRTMGVLASVKGDGSPDLANMIHVWDPEAGGARISTVDDRVKVTHYRRDPTAVLHVTTGDFRSWGAAQGTVAVSPVATSRTDEVADELAAMHGPFADAVEEAQFRAQMVTDHRRVLRLTPTNFCGARLG